MEKLSQPAACTNNEMIMHTGGLIYLRMYLKKLRYFSLNIFYSNKNKTKTF